MDENKNHIYRNFYPSGKYDMVIISLVHQDFSMVQYMSKNIERFVKGSFIWVVHANGGSYNENDLPSWAWLTRTTLPTIHSTTYLMRAIIPCIDFALEHIEFTNCMYISSGSVFFREYIVPKEESICMSSHETIFFPDKRFTYTEPIPIEYLGNCANYIVSKGGIHYNGWQYNNYFPSGMDQDIYIQEIIKKRGVSFIKGCHIPGQVFPYTVCKMLVDDGKEYFSKDICYRYCLEEIFPSTYAYSYAIKNNINIQKNVVYCNWLHKYTMDDIPFIESLALKCPDAYAIVKVPCDLTHPVREYLKG
jgi:hypothetical protein